MTILNRKLLRELWRTKWMLLAICAIMAVGVMCFIYMNAAHANLSAAKERYYAQGRMADFWIDLKKVPLAELAPLADLPGVTEIRPRIAFSVTVDLERARRPLNGLVLSLPDDRKPIINDIVLKRGGYFTGRRAEEVIVNDAFARKHALAPGQWIHLILNNRRQELLIVGTAISCEFVYLLSPGSMAPDPEHFGIFYLKRTYAEEVFGFDGAANQIVGRLAPEVRDHPDALLKQAEIMFDDFGVGATTALEHQASNQFVSDEIRGLGSFALFMPAIFLAVAAMVLNVLISRIVDQQRTVIGTLKALGYSDWEVTWHFIKFALVLGLVAGLLGCAMGYLMGNLVAEIYQQFFEFPELMNRVYWDTYLGGMAISLGCALVGSLHGARLALRLRPAEAMRPKPPAKGGAVWLQRVGWFWRRLSFSWRMTLRNVIRNRLRTAVGVFACTMGTALLVFGLVMRASMFYLIDFQFQKMLRADVDLTFEQERGEDALLEARELPSVDYAEPVLGVACDFHHGSHHRKGAVTGLVPGAKLTVPYDAEERPVEIPASGLVMTRKMAELLHVGVGDSVSIVPIKGLRQPRTAHVAAIINSYMGLAVYADVHYLSRLVGEELAISGVQLKTDPARRQQDALFRELKEMPALQAVQVKTDTIRNIERTLIDTNMIFISLMVLFAGVIFFGSVLNASLVSLAERQREVATLRVLGYSQWNVGNLFLQESLLVFVAGTLLGAPLGYGLCKLLTMAYDTEMFRFPLIAPIWSWIGAISLGLLFNLAAHAFVQRSINRMNYLEALNARE